MQTKQSGPKALRSHIPYHVSQNESSEPGKSTQNIICDLSFVIAALLRLQHALPSHTGTPLTDRFLSRLLTTHSVISRSPAALPLRDASPPSARHSESSSGCKERAQEAPPRLTVPLSPVPCTPAPCGCAAPHRSVQVTSQNHRLQAGVLSTEMTPDSSEG